jgi:hypothetical protein
MEQTSLLASQTRQVQPVHWVILAIITLLTILIIVIPVILFLLTKNTYTLMPTAGLIPISYAWKHMLHFFFPKKPQDYELEKEKIWAKALMKQRRQKS